ncbi:C6 finger domain-containing protein [Colletotrichum truncatum]|uniref:C6 finger domain-containing protein n=1 Tax=Colletotrichum truncatum TaxID=5467 RepID=A0ACC3ZFT6_COLTU
MSWEPLLPSLFPTSPLSFLDCEPSFLNVPAGQDTTNTPSTAVHNNPNYNTVAPYKPVGISWLQQYERSGQTYPEKALIPMQSPKTTQYRIRSNLTAQSENDSSLDVFPKFYHRTPLFPRVRKPLSTYLTAKVLLGQLLSYPAMMAKGGRLPPTIFPQCVINGTIPPSECSSQGYHQCLPEELAICSSLVQSFEARTPGSEAFVWANIYKEIERIRKESNSFGRDRLLAAMQALTIYVLLQTRDRDSIPKHDIDMLLSTPLLLARRLCCQAPDFASNLINGASLDRKEWVFRESLRRYDVVNFFFKLLSLNLAKGPHV